MPDSSYTEASWNDKASGSLRGEKRASLKFLHEIEVDFVYTANRERLFPCARKQRKAVLRR
jgi:hypothetical protein